MRGVSASAARRRRQLVCRTAPPAAIRGDAASFVGALIVAATVPPDRSPCNRVVFARALGASLSPRSGVRVLNVRPRASGRRSPPAPCGRRDFAAHGSRSRHIYLSPWKERDHSCDGDMTRALPIARLPAFWIERHATTFEP